MKYMSRKDLEDFLGKFFDDDDSVEEHYDKALLPDRLQLARKYRALSQEELGRELSIHATSYQKYEAGIRQPNAVQLAVIANLERIDLNYFFLGRMTLKDADLDIRQIETPIMDRLGVIQKMLMKIYEKL